MVLANDSLFLREVLKDYIDKHDRNLKKSFMKSYAAHTSNPAKEETEYTKQSNCHICGGTHNMGNCTIFNKQTVEERSRTLVKKKLYYGCYMPIIVDHNARTCSNKGHVNLVIKIMRLVCMGMLQREEVEVTLQLHLQLILRKMTTLEQAVYKLSVTLLRWT